MLVATGHPIGLRPVHTAVARALQTAGCTLLAAASGWQHPHDSEYATQGQIRFHDHVGVLAAPGGRLQHTHSPMPMRAVLAELAATGQAPPDLVIADHCWAGAAGQAGVDVVAFADCNDPALFVGEVEGRIRVCVPLDDNLDPTLYQPLSAYLLHHARLTKAGTSIDTRT